MAAAAHFDRIDLAVRTPVRIPLDPPNFEHQRRDHYSIVDCVSAGRGIPGSQLHARLATVVSIVSARVRDLVFFRHPQARGRGHVFSHHLPTVLPRQGIEINHGDLEPDEAGDQFAAPALDRRRDRASSIRSINP
jgi:hypothetical protein